VELEWNGNGKLWNWNGAVIFWMELERNGTLITVPFRVGTVRFDFHLIHEKVHLIESFSRFFIQFRQKYSNPSSN
jgi:hypothetical protein